MVWYPRIIRGCPEYPVIYRYPVVVGVIGWYPQVVWGCSEYLWNPYIKQQTAFLDNSGGEVAIAVQAHLQLYQ